MAKGGKTVAEVFVPEKVSCMPDKRIFLARAGARYNFLVKEADFLERANKLFLEGFSHIDPVIYHITSDANALPPQLLPSIFQGVKRVTVFISTLGEEIDNLISSYLNQGKTFDAFLLDAWASESLEVMNESFDKELRQQFGEGTMRFSPGYGDVDIRMNHYIVKELIKMEKVKVLSSGEMVPRKTTTCMIGWYR